MKSKEFFITGIDTDCGKTYITGLLAFYLKSLEKTITTKVIQTGCIGISDDIISHRKSMNIDLLPEDLSLKTCPYVYTYPASPHIAAKMDNHQFKKETVRQNIDDLKNQYKIILSEGAGGIMSPIDHSYLTSDYIKEYNLPVILVSSSKLGNINHTLLSLQLCLSKNINLHTLIYNVLPNCDDVISESSFDYINEFIKANFTNVHIVKSNEINSNIVSKIFFQ